MCWCASKREDSQNIMQVKINDFDKAIFNIKAH